MHENPETILGQTYFEARPFNGRSLSAQVLADNGLAPDKSVTVAGKTVYISQPFWVEKRQESAWIGYVETEQGYLVRTFFWSRSQAIARVLLGYRYKKDNENEQITHHYKGYGEQSMFLPVALQKLLATSIPAASKITDEELAFYGSVTDSWESSVYARTVAHEPIRLDGNFYSEEKDEKIPPEEAVFYNPEQAPDFTRAVERWKAPTSLYGDLDVLVFASHDKTLQCQFNRDQKHRVWLAGVEAVGCELSDCGVRNTWVDAGVLATPVYEYRKQAGGYGNPADSQGEYVDMYANYLSQIPVMRQLRNIYAPSKNKNTGLQ